MSLRRGRSNEELDTSGAENTSDFREDLDTANIQGATMAASQTVGTPGEHVSALISDKAVAQIMQSLGEMEKRMHSKMESLIKEIEEKINKKFNELEEKLSQNMEACTKLVNEKCNAVRTELTAQHSELENRMQAIDDRLLAVEEHGAHGINEDSLKIVIKNLPARENEDIVQCVNTLVSEGIKIENVTVVDAKRNPGFRENHPGIVIANCRSKQDKELLMASKSNLRKNAQFKNVHVEHFKSYEQRRLDANLYAIVNAVGHNKLYMRDSRVLRAKYNTIANNNNNRQNQHVNNQENNPVNTPGNAGSGPTNGPASGPANGPARGQRGGRGQHRGGPGRGGRGFNNRQNTF